MENSDARPKKSSLISGFRGFGVICIGQFVSLIGTGLTSFALGVWVYQMTGSVTSFALIALCSSLPGILLSPLAGALVDRMDRRLVMILSDSAAGVATFSIALLLYFGLLEIWHIYLATAINSAANAFQWPAYSAATTLLVPKQHLGRASGLVQLSEAISRIVSPAAAGLLIAIIQISGVLLLDLATFLFAVSTLLLVRIPKPPASKAGQSAAAEAAEKSSLLAESKFGWTYIRERPGLTQLLFYFSLSNLFISLGMVLFTPLILSFNSAAVLGSTLAIASSGMLVGSLLMSVWGGTKKRIHGMLAFSTLLAVSMILTGLRPSIPLIAVALFLFNFTLPFINGASQAIWQSKVEPRLQGRVFAVRHMFARATFPVAQLAAGPLADKIFEPMFVNESALSQLFGTGAGRGIGFLISLQGGLFLIVTLLAIASRRLTLLEDELPDSIPDAEALPPEA